MIDQNGKQLSPAGVARKKAMLSQLVRQMNYVHRTRQIRRRAVHSFTLLIVCVITLWVVLPQYLKPQPTGKTGSLAKLETQQQLPEATFIRTINDDELIALLAQINRPAGVVRSQGRIWLTNAVTDEELDVSENVPAEKPSSM